MVRISLVARPEPVLIVHPTAFQYPGDADPLAPGGMSAIYRDLVAADDRTKSGRHRRRRCTGPRKELTCVRGHEKVPAGGQAVRLID